LPPAAFQILSRGIPAPCSETHCCITRGVYLSRLATIQRCKSVGVAARLMYTNPHEQPRTETNTPSGKTTVLQVILNTGEQLRCYGSAFTRQRSLVRTQHRPLSKFFHLQVKPEVTTKIPGTCQAFVQQPCSNANCHLCCSMSARSPRPRSHLPIQHSGAGQSSAASRSH
jgi:hypothetical protein